MCWWCSTTTVLPTLGPRDPLLTDNPSPYKTTGRRHQNRDSLHIHQQFTLRPEVQPKKSCSSAGIWTSIESVRAALHSANIWTQCCIMGSCSILFTTFLLVSMYSGRLIMPYHRKIGIEATSIIYCTVLMGHWFLWSACISVTKPTLHNVN